VIFGSPTIAGIVVWNAYLRRKCGWWDGGNLFS